MNLSLSEELRQILGMLFQHMMKSKRVLFIYIHCYHQSDAQVQTKSEQLFEEKLTNFLKVWCPICIIAYLFINY